MAEMDPNATQALVADPMKTAMGMPAPGLGATQAIAPVQCPVCKQHNPPGEIYCVECGLLFTSEMVEEPVAEAAPLPCLVEAGGREQHLRLGSNIIGRDGTDILLNDSRVSRRHADLSLAEDGSATIEDLGSTNGTMVGTARLESGQKIPVENGTKLFFGGLEMTLSLPGEAMRTAAMPAAAPPAEDAVDAVAHLVGPDGTKHPIIEGETTLGRRSTNNIVIPDAFLSGNHAKFVSKDDGLYFVDIRSTNGSAYNQRKVEPNEEVKIADGDEITFGQTTYVVRFPEK